MRDSRHALISKSFYRKRTCFSPYCVGSVSPAPLGPLPVGAHLVTLQTPLPHPPEYQVSLQSFLLKCFPDAFRLIATDVFCQLGDSRDGAFEVQARRPAPYKQALAGTAFPPHKDLSPLPRVL